MDSSQSDDSKQTNKQTAKSILPFENPQILY